MTSGLLSIILHAHLPFVKHPEREDSLEGRWLFQAISECYLPLLSSFGRLLEDDVPFRVGVSLSPPLLEMLSDPLLKERYKSYLENLIELAEKEIGRTSGDVRLQNLAKMYRERFDNLYTDFTETFREDLIGPWKDLESCGRVELLASAATHGYLPLLLNDQAVRAQVKAGIAAYRKHFRRNPQSFWLPECAYSPEVENALSEEGISSFILETHGVLYASPRPKYGYHAPLLTPKRLLAFGRDPDCSKQVWSAEEGYPGDGSYREFYRDIGYELPISYLGKAIPDACRVPTGIKYHRVTDRRSQHKELYEPERALARAKEHAQNFVFWRNKESEHWQRVLGRQPVMVAPYDAELFGHWWYEGPSWLEFVFRQLAQGPTVVTPITPSEYVNYYPVNQVAQPAISSWGYKGYHEVWLEGSNDWIYRDLHSSQERLLSVASSLRSARGLLTRALNQAVREMFLAQSSDWPFIMKTGSVPEYARYRFTNHIQRLQRLLDQIEEGSPDPAFLKEIEESDSVFRDLDLSGLYTRAL
jgi:1,4-alpha-glucan branching enzyme